MPLFLLHVEGLLGPRTEKTLGVSESRLVEERSTISDTGDGRRSLSTSEWGSGRAVD